MIRDIQKKNLIPAKKGEIRNSHGRGKGIPNRSTLVKTILESKAVPSEKIVKKLQKLYPSVFKKRSKKWVTQLVMTAKVAQKALEKGDVLAYKTLMDYAYKEENEPQNKIVNVNIIQYNTIKKDDNNSTI